MKPIISIRNLSKKYILYHEMQNAYSTFVDTMARKTKTLVKKLKNYLTGRAAENNEKRYEVFWALKDLELDIQEGDRVGIIGRNGAGKSTLLKLISRITTPTTGAIGIRGSIASLLEVGTGFHQELSGRENIFLNGSILGMKRHEIIKNFDEIIAFAEIEQFLDTPMKRYSSGMCARLGFAIAAQLNPDILIIDEVLSVGDTVFQQKCLKKLDELSSKGRTILFVSHDIGSVLTLCNKGIYLENGRLQSYGDIESCVNLYMKQMKKHVFTWEGIAGDEHIQFSKVMVIPPVEDRPYFYQNENAIVVMELEITSPHPDLFLGLALFNTRNQLLAQTYLHDCINKEISWPNRGKYKIRYHLDTSFIYEGDYFLKIDCGILNQKRIINDTIVLHLPIYQINKNTRLLQGLHKTGMFLGNQWNSEIIEVNLEPSLT